MRARRPSGGWDGPIAWFSPSSFLSNLFAVDAAAVTACPCHHANSSLSVSKRAKHIHESLNQTKYSTKNAKRLSCSISSISSGANICLFTMRCDAIGNIWGLNGNIWGLNGNISGLNGSFTGNKKVANVLPMKKTTQIAADRAYDEAKTVLPAEVARGVYIENPPSAEALKLMHLLIGRAGGRMAEDVRHELRLADIKKITGMRNHTRASLRQLFIELAGAVMVFDDTEAQCEVVGGFLDRAKLDYRHEISDDLLIAWWFGGAFREMAEKSCHWAILDRQTVFALSSKYSILLFQHITSLVNLDHVSSKTFPISELRAVLGVSDGKMDRFSNLNQRVIIPAIAEINQTSRLTLTATPRKIGRAVASVTIAWEDKGPEEKRGAKAELDRAKVGRKARREGRSETPVVVFPSSGRIDGPWEVIARNNAPRLQGNHVPDLLVLSEAFRRWCAEKSINLDAKSIEKTFTTWCKSYTPR
jgi:hypothetical protein